MRGAALIDGFNGFFLQRSSFSLTLTKMDCVCVWCVALGDSLLFFISPICVLMGRAEFDWWSVTAHRLCCCAQSRLTPLSSLLISLQVVASDGVRAMMESALTARDRVGVQDFVLLENFTSEAAFIENLRKRFKENLIYVSGCMRMWGWGLV